MRFMIIVRAPSANDTASGADEHARTALAAYREALARAGVLLDASSLEPASQGTRVRYAAGKCSVVDGARAGSPEVVASYAIVQTRTRAEAIEWAKRIPVRPGEDCRCELEIRQLLEPEESSRNAHDAVLQLFDGDLPCSLEGK